LLASNLYAAASGGTLTTFVQSVVLVLIGPLGWILLLGLIVAGIIAWASKKYGAFALDFAFAVLLAWMIFNPDTAQNLLKSSSGGIHG